MTEELSVGFISRNFRIDDDGSFFWHAVAQQRVVLPVYGLSRFGGVPTVLGPQYVVHDGLIHVKDGGTVNHPTPVVVLHMCFRDEDIRAVTAARRRGQKVVVDLDDDYWNVPSSNAAHSQYGPDVQARIGEMIKLSDAVIVSTQHLCGAIGHPHVALIRNTARVDSFTRLPVRKNPPVFRVGYAGAVEHHHDDLLLLKDWLDTWMTEHSAQLVHLGHRTPGELFELLGISPSNRAESIPLVSLFDYPRVLARCRFDVGLVTLVDGPFSEGKSHLKGLDYASAGIPFIAAPTAEYRHFGQGIVAPVSTWREALSHTLDWDVREKMAHQALDAAYNYDIAVKWTEYDALFRSLL